MKWWNNHIINSNMSLIYLITRWCNHNIYSWPLNDRGLTCIGPLICRFCSINIELVLCIPGFWVLHALIQQTANRKQYFPSAVGNSRLWKANCVDSSMLYYVRDLSFWGVWYPLGSWNKTSTDTEGQLSLHV